MIVCAVPISITTSGRSASSPRAASCAARGHPTLQYSQFDAKDLHCEALLLKTSNPPKKQLEFQLDDVHYVALVTITDDQPRLVKADDESEPPKEP